MGETQSAVTVIVGLVGLAGAYMIGRVARRWARSRRRRAAGRGGSWWWRHFGTGP